MTIKSEDSATYSECQVVEWFQWWADILLQDNSDDENFFLKLTKIANLR